MPEQPEPRTTPSEPSVNRRERRRLAKLGAARVAVEAKRPSWVTMNGAEPVMKVTLIREDRGGN